jgi:hypothetical protein
MNAPGRGSKSFIMPLVAPSQNPAVSPSVEDTVNAAKNRTPLKLWCETRRYCGPRHDGIAARLVTARKENGPATLSRRAKLGVSDYAACFNF